MDEYIKGVLSYARQFEYHQQKKTAEFFYDLADYLKSLPTVEAKPMIHGYNRHEEYKGYCEFWCSECGFLIFEYHEGDDDIREFSYCPNCGAKMDGKKVQDG